MLSFNPHNGFFYLYKKAVDITFLLSVEPDNRYRLIGANQAYFDVTGLCKEKVIGKYSDELIEEKNVALMYQKFKEAIELRESVKYEEVTYLFTKLFIFETIISPIFNDAGKCIRLQGLTRDITERKTLQKQLRNAVANFTALIENSQDSIWSVNRNYVITAINSKFREDYQTFYNVRLEVGTNIIETANPDLRLSWIELYNRAFNGSHFTVEQCHHSNGKTIYVEVSFHPILGENNIINDVFVFSRDITKRKLAEKKSEELILAAHELNQDLVARECELNETLKSLALSNQKLAKSEEYFRALIKQSSDIITILEEDGTIRYKSPSFYRIMGYMQSDVVGRNIFEFIHPGCLENVKNAFKILSVRSGILKPLEFKFLKKDGSYLTIESVGSNCLNDRNIAGIIVHSRDVSIRKQLEEALQRNTKITMDMIKVAPFPIVVTDLTGNVYYINDRTSELFNVSSEEASKMKTTDFYVDPSIREHLIETIQKTGYINDFEMQMKDSKGKCFHVQLSAKTMYYDDRLCIISFINNITERKISEEKLRQKNRELEKINKELDKFVYSASHDLRSPIASVLGLVNLAKREAEDQQQHIYFDLMSTSLWRLDALIKEIIQYSKNGKLEVKPETVDFSAVAMKAIESVQQLEGADKISYDVDINQGDPFMSDVSRITVLFNNLVSNAFKYSDLNKKRPFIAIHVKTNLNRAFISVRDNGTGLKKHHLPKIFDMFYAVAENSGDTGMALYIVKETVEKLQGKIEVESVFGKGSNFKIELPSLTGKL